MRPLPSLSIARNVAFASDLSLKGKPSFFAALDSSCEGVGQSREEEGVRVRVYEGGGGRVCCCVLLLLGAYILINVARAIRVDRVEDVQKVGIRTRA